jgi:pyridoxine 5-phosphate synthase
MTLLSVNVNKVAVLRNSRGGQSPDVVQAAKVALDAGAAGITVHPRPDLRHIHPADCHAIGALLRSPAYAKAEFNIEGNPLAPANSRYPGLLQLIEETRPEQATLVPDGDGQITSDHGWQISANAALLEPLIAKIHACGARVSVFVDDDISSAELALAKKLGVDRVEIYTGPFAHGFGIADHAALERCADVAKRAADVGLGVNAGHDLSQKNLAALLARAPVIAEVSIGHALFEEAIYEGLAKTVRAYLAILGAN